MLVYYWYVSTYLYKSNITRYMASPLAQRPLLPSLGQEGTRLASKIRKTFILRLEINERPLYVSSVVQKN